MKNRKKREIKKSKPETVNLHQKTSETSSVSNSDEGARTKMVMVLVPRDYDKEQLNKTLERKFGSQFREGDVEWFDSKLEEEEGGKPEQEGAVIREPVDKQRSQLRSEEESKVESVGEAAVSTGPFPYTCHCTGKTGDLHRAAFRDVDNALPFEKGELAQHKACKLCKEGLGQGNRKSFWRGKYGVLCCTYIRRELGEGKHPLSACDNMWHMSCFEDFYGPRNENVELLEDMRIWYKNNHGNDDGSSPEKHDAVGEEKGEGMAPNGQDGAKTTGKLEVRLCFCCLEYFVK